MAAAVRFILPFFNEIGRRAATDGTHVDCTRTVFAAIVHDDPDIVASLKLY